MSRGADEPLTLNQVLLDQTQPREAQRVLIGGRDAGVEEHSYAEVIGRSGRIMESLRVNGLEPGDRVLVILPTSFDFVCAFLGVSLAGGVAVPLAPQSMGVRNPIDYVERVRHVVGSCAPRFAIVDDKQREFEPLRGALGGLRLLAVSELATMSSGAPRFAEAAAISPDQLCFLQYTSGSTGQAKGVPVTHGALVANARAVARAGSVQPSDFLVTWLPLYHDMGLIGGFLSPLVHGMSFMLFPTEVFIFRPVLWLKYISEYRAEVSLASNFALKYVLRRLKDEDLQSLHLSSLRVVYNGSEPINADLLEDFYQRLKVTGYRREAMMPCYGLAEAALAVSCAHPERPPRVARIRRESLWEHGVAEEADAAEDAVAFVSVGVPVTGVRVKVVGADGRELEEGSVGEIWVDGPSIMRGYYGHGPDQVREYLHDGWLVTGDIGFLRGGELFVTGRKKDVVIIRGRNISAVDIEESIKARFAPAVSECAAISYPHSRRQEEVLAVVYESKSRCADSLEELENDIRALVLDTFNIDAHEVVKVRKVPKTLNGKVARSACYSKCLLPLQRSSQRSEASSA